MPKFKLPPRLPFRSLGIAGLGLIGGSLAKAFAPLDGLELSVFDANPDTIREARKIRRFARVTTDPEEFCLFPLDLAYLCLPVRRNLELMERMARLKAPYCLTDSGSTKGPATEKALALGLNYCGGHPIAGKEVAGFAHSEASLIRGCLFILTPDPRFGPRQKDLLRRLRGLHELLDCRIRIMSPAQHDKIYALVSHLPYIAASALSGTAQMRGDSDILSWAGTGFRDTTRVSASPPAKWVEVALENAQNISEDIDSLIKVLNLLKTLIIQGDGPGLQELLDSYSAFRRTLPDKYPPKK
jgi:prephenate dehydrogenase